MGRQDSWYIILVLIRIMEEMLYSINHYEIHVICCIIINVCTIVGKYLNDSTS